MNKEKASWFNDDISMEDVSDNQYVCPWVREFKKTFNYRYPWLQNFNGTAHELEMLLLLDDDDLDKRILERIIENASC